MKIPNLKRSRPIVSVVFACIATALAAGSVVQVAASFAGSASAEHLLRRVEAQYSEPNSTQELLEKVRAEAGKLKENNPFMPPPEKKHPVKEVAGIIGDEAIIEGKMYKVGDKIKDAKIVAIEPTFVTIEWQGEKKDFAPIAATVKYDEKTEKHAPPAPQPLEVKQEMQPEPQKAEIAELAEEDPLAWLGVEISAALREKLLEKWNELTDEQKKEWKQRWSKMSQEQKERMIQAMESNVDKM